MTDIPSGGSVPQSSDQGVIHAQEIHGNVIAAPNYGKDESLDCSAPLAHIVLGVITQNFGDDSNVRLNILYVLIPG